MRCVIAIALFALAAGIAPTVAYGDGESTSPVAEYMHATGASADFPAFVDSAAAAVYQWILDSTETINRIYNEYVEAHGQFGILRDLNIQFKSFYPSGDSSTGALGFSYNYSRDIHRNLISQDPARAVGLAATIRATGNVAFEEDINPTDFLSSSFAIHLFRSSGGTVRNRDSLLAYRLNALEDAMAEYTSENELAASKEWKEFSGIIQRHLSTQLYLDFALTAALESNQQFTQKQWAYGAQIGVDLKAWRESSTLALLNIFDWAPALLRVLTGFERDIVPRGSAIPTVLFALERVESKDDPHRVSVDPDEASFPRLRGEVAFRTQISSGASLAANARMYKELGASDAIELAGLDEYRYMSVAISMTSGLFISYTTGRLPFDDHDDQIYELGFQYKLR